MTNTPGEPGRVAGFSLLRTRADGAVGANSIREPYKGRNVVERCFNRLKDFRAVATRFDKRGYNDLSGVLLASIVLWL